MPLDQRGFGSIEFIFVSLIVFLIIGGLVSIVGNEMNQTQTGDVAQARVTGEKIAETINTVYINGMGYNITLTVPTGMTVYVNNATGNVNVFSSSTGKNISVKLIPKNVQSTTLNAGQVKSVVYSNNGTISFI